MRKIPSLQGIFYFCKKQKNLWQLKTYQRTIWSLFQQQVE